MVWLLLLRLRVAAKFTIDLVLCALLCAKRGVIVFFSKKKKNPVGETPSQVIQTMSISRELRLARKIKLHRYVPLADAVV